MYGLRGSLFGSGGVSDGYEIGSKRPRLESNPYFAVTSSPRVYQPQYGRRYQPSAYPVVRLRGLPFNCSDVDVYKFFAGLDIVDVFLVNKDGKFSGEGFVVFAGQMQADLALQRDRQNMGRRYVEVFRCTKQEYYNAIAAEVNKGGTYGGTTSHRGFSPANRRKRSPDKDSVVYSEILKLRGLPYSVKKSDILKFFEDFNVTEDRIQITSRSDGRATGEAFVEFVTPEEAKKAMSKDRSLIGSRYVELFPSTLEEARQAASRSRQ